MRRNQAILDEAARSVRRTFIGSVAGTGTMLAVVGAAGAYGMPERLNAHSLSVALASLQMKLAPMMDRPPPFAQRPITLAAAMTTRSDASALDDEVVVPVPKAQPSPVQAVVTETVVQETAAPEPAPPTVAAPSITEAPAAAPAVAAVPAEPPPVAPVEAAAPAAPGPAPVAETTARVTPRAMPRAMPGVVPVEPMLPSPMVFEAPQLDAIPPLQAMPQMVVLTPVVEQPAPAKEQPKPLAKALPKEPAKLTIAPVSPEAAKAPEKPAEKPAEKLAGKPAPVQLASAPAAVDPPNPADFPKTVWVLLPQPKPPLTPAQRLDLIGADYDKAEKCLAQAIYFEARAEPVRGQQAVAQVVLNRVFSPYYPKDVCSVVYQNAHRHLSCQFTFACDGKPEAIRERGAWARATRIAKQTLDAKVWLPEVAKATHYHATYVRPNWIRDMKVMVRFGVHIFYRPRNWGDGSNEPGWGTPQAAAAAAVTTVAHKKGG